jgi:hypothetical protein
MRGDMVAMLAYEAKNKPEIKELVDKIHELTIEDIQNAVVPLPWYRQALLLMKQREAHAQLLARMNDVEIGKNTDPKGWTAKWHDTNTFINLERGNSVEIKTNTLIWFPEDGGVWIETIFSNLIDAKLLTLKQTELMTKSQYMIAYRERINNLNHTSVIDMTAGTAAKPIFTITRH